MPVKNASRVLNALVDCTLGRSAQPQRESHILIDGHVGIEREILKHHRDVTLFRRKVIYDTAIDFNFSCRDVFQSCDHAQQRGLSAAGWADKDHELAILGRRIDLIDDFRDAEKFRHIREFHAGHRYAPGAPIELAPSPVGINRLSNRRATCRLYRRRRR